jgi:hypothetical protein
MTTATPQHGKFCWPCYEASIQRVAATLDRDLRRALLRAAAQYRPAVTTGTDIREHARHAGTAS